MTKGSDLVLLLPFESHEIGVRSCVKRKPCPAVLSQLDALLIEKQNEAKGPGLFIQLLNARGTVTVDTRVAQQICFSANF